jgi:hypothetical protein
MVINMKINRLLEISLILLNKKTVTANGQALVWAKYGWGAIAAEMEKVYERCPVK